MAINTAAIAATRRFGRRTLLAVSAATVLVLGGISLYVARGIQVQAAITVKPEKAIFVALEPLTVNLQAEGKPKFLHLGVSLKVGDEDAQARISQSLPELRSRLLLLLSNRDPAMLLSPNDKRALAEEIKTELNRPPTPGLPMAGITGVAFTAFVVQ